MDEEKIIVKLPSKGECYPHKKGEVAISPMTAMDENILADKKLNNEGKSIDTLLEKKILDKDFKVNELCVGDRDAILLHLLMHSYGNMYVDFNKRETIDLSKIKYSEFNIVGDKNGLFSYKPKKGTMYKFRLMRDADDKIGYQMLEENDSEEGVENFKRWYLGELTFSINNIKDKSAIQKHITSLSDSDVNKYFDYIYTHDAYVETDIDFEVALCEKIIFI